VSVNTSSNLRRCKLSEQSFKISIFFFFGVVVPSPPREEFNDENDDMLVAIKTATFALFSTKRCYYKL